MFRIAIEYFDFVMTWGVYFGSGEDGLFFSGTEDPEDIEDYIDIEQMQNVGI